MRETKNGGGMWLYVAIITMIILLNVLVWVVYSNEDKMKRLLIEQAGRPLPTSKLPDGEFVSYDGHIIFHDGRCYLAPTKSQIQVGLNRLSDKPTFDRWDSKNSKLIPLQPNPVDQLAVQIAKKYDLGNNMHEYLVIKHGEKIRVYTFDRGIG